MSVQYDPPASLEIQKVYDDPAQDQLAHRIEEILELMETDPGNVRLRLFRMQRPALWLVRIYGSGREFALLWDLGLDGQPFVRWAGDF